MFVRSFLVGLAFASVFGSASRAQAILQVPAQYPSIQAAIASAQPGDTVSVDAGTYLETVDFLGKAITVVSVAGPDMTTIDASATGTVVTFASGENSNTLLEGFTITGGRAAANGGGILCVGASPTIRNCRIVSNFAYFGCDTVMEDPDGPVCAQALPGGHGGGAALVDSNATFETCLFETNRAGDGGAHELFSATPPGGNGGALYAAGTSIVTLTACVFSGNRSGTGGLVYYIDGVTGNGGDGGAIFATDSSTLSVSGCTFSGNVTGHGGPSETGEIFRAAATAVNGGA